MKPIAYVLGLILSASLLTSSYAQSIDLPKVDLLKNAKGKKVYLISDTEIDVKGNLIKRVEIGENTAIITYLNKSQKAASPNFNFRLINAYGIEVASFTEHWLIYSIPAGDTKKENKDFYRHCVQDILELSVINLPKDWKVPIYLVIDGDSP